ncbi:MAG: helix-turn-helix transcriptional regulator [Bacteroidota bacterium]
MIKNKKQATVAKSKFTELRQALKDFELQKDQMSPAEYLLGFNTLNEVVEDLTQEINEYEALCRGEFYCFKPEKLNDINKVLIAARIAKGISHKKLGDMIGVQEQQIQRYEATDYESVNWSRIQEIAEALKLKFYFDKIRFLPLDTNDQYTGSYSSEEINDAANKASTFGLMNIVSEEEKILIV